MLSTLVDRILPDAVAAAGFSGVTLVARGDDVVVRCFGLANRPFGVPNQRQTRFRIASVGKMYTAVAVLRQVAQGRLRLSDRVVDRIDLRGAAISEAVTLHHLLSMTAGIADWYEEGGDSPDTWASLAERTPLYRLRTNSDFLPLFVHKAAQFAPGTGYAYSNASYILLGLVLEQALGCPYAEVLQREVFAPAGMAASGLWGLDEVVDQVAEGYTTTAAGVRRNIYLSTGPAADGGATSTVDDLRAFFVALRTGALLPPALVQAMTTAHGDDGEGRGYRWGYGYGLNLLHGMDGALVRYGHTGEEDGVSARAWHYPGLGIDVVLLGNETGCVGDVGWAVHGAVVG